MFELSTAGVTRRPSPLLVLLARRRREEGGAGRCRGLLPLSGAGGGRGTNRLDGPPGVVARAHQRAGLHMGEAEALGEGAEVGELVGMPPLDDGQVEGRGPQV